MTRKTVAFRGAREGIVTGERWKEGGGGGEGGEEGPPIVSTCVFDGGE